MSFGYVRKKVDKFLLMYITLSFDQPLVLGDGNGANVIEVEPIESTKYDGFHE